MYVSNLGFHVTEEDLRKLFEPFGQVTSAKLIIDRESGRSRGFGFVQMDVDDEANKAMGALNNKQIEGRNISVAVAREKERSNDRKRW
jgi:RNA recognition motif-containing protein